ncbi:MAG: hypothetical protein ACE14U_00475 [Candidatus Velamenicoccus archaeovorus]
MQKNISGVQFIQIIFRNFLFFLLPEKLCKKIYRGEFAFLANLPNLNVVPKGFWFTIAKLFFKQLPPLIVSEITGFKDKKHREIKGITIICFLTAAEIMADKKLAAKKVLCATKIAEKAGAKIISLGAFTSIAVHDGFDLVGKTRIGITTGNTFSAVVAVKNVERAANLLNVDLQNSVVAVVGAAGSVGSGCVKYFYGKVKKIVMVDINLKELGNLKQSLGFNKTELQLSDSLVLIQCADFVIVVTNAVKGIVKAEHLKQNAIVIDGAYPSNVSVETITSRPDIWVISSAIAKVPGINLNFNLGLNSEEVHGCLGEALILYSLNRTANYGLGKVEISFMNEMINAADSLGLEIASFRNALGPLKIQRN